MNESLGVFRCYYCDELKNLSQQKLLNDINLCVKCYPTYKEFIKPKVRVHRLNEKDEIDKEIEDYERTKQIPKKKKGKK